VIILPEINGGILYIALKQYEEDVSLTLTRTQQYIDPRMIFADRKRNFVTG